MRRSEGGDSSSSDYFSLSKSKRRKTTQRVQDPGPGRSLALSQIRDYGSGSGSSADSLVSEIDLVSESDSSVEILDDPYATL